MDNQSHEFEQLQNELAFKLNAIQGYDKYNYTFRKNDYEELAKRINEKVKIVPNHCVRNKIDWQTLRKVIKYEHTIYSPLDPKFRKTLDLLSIFLDYKSWADFRIKSRTVTIPKIIIKSVHNCITVIDMICQGYQMGVENYFTGVFLKNLRSTKIYDFVLREIYLGKIEILILDHSFCLVSVNEYRLKERRGNKNSKTNPKPVYCIYRMEYKNGIWLLENRFLIISEKSILIE